MYLLAARVSDAVSAMAPTLRVATGSKLDLEECKLRDPISKVQICPGCRGAAVPLLRGAAVTGIGCSVNSFDEVTYSSAELSSGSGFISN